MEYQLYIQWDYGDCKEENKKKKKRECKFFIWEEIHVILFKAIQNLISANWLKNSIPYYFVYSTKNYSILKAFFRIQISLIYITIYSVNVRTG